MIHQAANPSLFLGRAPGRQGVAHVGFELRSSQKQPAFKHPPKKTLNALPYPQVRAEDFFLGYRKVDLAPHEVLARVAIPFTAPSEYAREFKQAHRRDDDIAIVNAGMRVRFSRGAAGGETLSVTLCTSSLCEAPAGRVAAGSALLGALLVVKQAPATPAAW